MQGSDFSSWGKSVAVVLDIALAGTCMYKVYLINWTPLHNDTSFKKLVAISSRLGHA